MGKFLDKLRAEYAEEEAGYKLVVGGGPKGDGLLYLGARMRDAEAEKKELEKRLVATERTAAHIITRYDADGSLYKEFKDGIQTELRHML